MDFEVYSIGIVHASVCTSLSDEEATKRINAEHPTGTSSMWAVSKSATFRDGNPNPCPCERNPKTHRHILFEC